MDPHTSKSNDPGMGGDRPRITASNSVSMITPVVLREKVPTSLCRGAILGQVERSTWTSLEAEASMALI